MLVLGRQRDYGQPASTRVSLESGHTTAELPPMLASLIAPNPPVAVAPPVTDVFPPVAAAPPNTAVALPPVLAAVADEPPAAAEVPLLALFPPIPAAPPPVPTLNDPDPPAAPGALPSNPEFPGGSGCGLRSTRQPTAQAVPSTSQSELRQSRNRIVLAQISINCANRQSRILGYFSTPASGFGTNGTHEKSCRCSNDWGVCVRGNSGLDRANSGAR